jgi:triosephosphate isomerase
MNKTIGETIDFINKVNDKALEVANEELIVGIAPSYICLPILRKLGTGIICFAQNVHFADNGAYTGEVSPLMLKEIGVNASLVGHSERRQYFNETNETCNKKLQTLENCGFNGLYCVGETLEEYEAGSSKDVVRTQVVEGLVDLTAEQVEELVIAYEPVWSIGTGRNASKEIAQDICGYIREVVKELYSAEVADKVIIQYGGSVKPENSYDYLTCPDIDGVLVGGASLKPESFEALVSAIMKG